MSEATPVQEPTPDPAEERPVNPEHPHEAPPGQTPEHDPPGQEDRPVKEGEGE